MILSHDPTQCVQQLRQALAADKLAVGFFIGAGCPCAVRVADGATDRPLIPDIKGLTNKIDSQIKRSKHAEPYQKLIGILAEDGDASPTIETVLNRIRSLREVTGNAAVRGMSFGELDLLDRELCLAIKQTVSFTLPNESTPYHALARFIRTQRFPLTELFTTNYDLLAEQALESCRVPYFDGFVGSSRPFFDQRAIEEDKVPTRWSRLWKLHGSINWRLNKERKSVFRSLEIDEGDELLIHPSHHKYDESRRMPYFVMIDRLRSFIRGDQKPVVLFVVGYSFADEHLNEAIVESLAANPAAVCFALQFGELDDYPKAKKLALENANLCLLARHSAIIRRHEAEWVAAASTDFTLIKCAFQTIGTDGADNIPAKDSDEPCRCRLKLGDFKVLGDFLDEFSSLRDMASAGIVA